MQPDFEVYNALRKLFADGQCHNSGEIVNVISSQYELSGGQIMRRVAHLCNCGEIKREGRGRFRKVVPPILEEPMKSVVVIDKVDSSLKSLWGNCYITVTPEVLKNLQQGKFLYINVLDEYSLFLRVGNDICYEAE